jgi:phospholipase C
VASECEGGDGGVAPASNIRHVVLIVQENHTFDTYFGRYCTAPAGSAPDCTDGPSCCEAAPDADPSGSPPIVLNDTSNAARDPDHSRACELQEVNGGAMDGFVAGPSCADARNFAIASDALMATYHRYAAEGALADRYFQPIIGSTSSNDMYLAIAQWQFFDNDYKPASDGAGCTLPARYGRISYTGRRTIGDLLVESGHTFGVYADGYRAMREALLCPAAPSDCPTGVPFAPCDYDPSDIPFEYYAQFTDNPAHMHDYEDVFGDITSGTLPDFVYVKAATYRNEHPRWSNLSRGVAFVSSVVDAIAASPYADDTLVLLTWDEGGGFYDHVAPPATIESLTDGTSLGYGTRVPMLAIGRFARRGTVSHVPMEHSSVVRFLEFNFLGPGYVGALGHRDAVVNNLGSLLDPAETGVTVPEN